MLWHIKGPLGCYTWWSLQTNIGLQIYHLSQFVHSKIQVINTIFTLFFLGIRILYPSIHWFIHSLYYNIEKGWIDGWMGLFKWIWFIKIHHFYSCDEISHKHFSCRSLVTWISVNEWLKVLVSIKQGCHCPAFVLKWVVSKPLKNWGNKSKMD